jgi:translation initiation factor 2B subunit (eIF-2B alpha/beta/delta family)
MKINEVSNLPRQYSATVRVVLRDATMTARTTITADTVHQARAMLTRIYGEGNVLSISEIVNESASTCQINAQASFPDQRRRSQPFAKKNAPTVFSCVAETENTTRVLSPAELQVKSLSDRAKQINQQAKQLKARQSLAKAQEKLRQAGADPA